MPPPWHIPSIVCAAVWAFFCASTPLQAELFSWISPELGQLEHQRSVLESHLKELPAANVPQLTERIGYHSGYALSAQTSEWVELDLKKTESVDSIVLVPAGSSGSGIAAPGYGFPLRFRVELFNEDRSVHELLADVTDTDFPNPGILPVFLSAAGQKIRYVRVTATRLFAEGDRYLFALGEIMVLQGRRNIAADLKRSNFTYKRTTGALPVWGLSNLVDGHTALGSPEGPEHSPTLGFCSQKVDFTKSKSPQLPWVQVDLGVSLPLDEIRLFPAHPPEFAHRSGYGWPAEIKVEVSEDAEFSKPTELLGFRDGSVSNKRTLTAPGDNPISFYCGQTPARFVRITALQLFDSSGLYLFALSELQAWSGNVNVALHKPVTASDSIEQDGWSCNALVDGFTSRANIVDWPEWLEGLSRRREVLNELALIENQRLMVTHRLLSIGRWILVGFAITGIIALIRYNRKQQRRRREEMEALRQRFSQDLHDEIGSSLGCIAFITEDAAALTHDESARAEFQEIRKIVLQTIDSMRDLVRLAQLKNYGDGDLVDHLRAVAERSLRGLSYTFEAEAAVAFNRIPIPQRRDIVLIFKETLHNLSRHAHATQASIRLTQEDQMLTLTVQDNGCGFVSKNSGDNGMGLHNLRRRATKCGGTLEIHSVLGTGTTVSIKIPSPE